MFISSLLFPIYVVTLRDCVNIKFTASLHILSFIPNTDSDTVQCSHDCSWNSSWRSFKHLYIWRHRQTIWDEFRTNIKKNTAKLQMKNLFIAYNTIYRHYGFLSIFGYDQEKPLARDSGNSTKRFNRENRFQFRILTVPTLQRLLRLFIV